MASKRRIKSQSGKTSESKPTAPSLQSVLPAENISACLARMTVDAAEIKERLLKAPLDLTGEGEPKLYDIICGIQGELQKANKIWSQ